MDDRDSVYRWIGLRTARNGMFDAGGVGHGAPTRTAGQTPFDESFMSPRGTLRIERVGDPAASPRNLVRLSRRDPVPVMLSVRIDPDGSLALILRRGASDILVTLDLPACPAGARMSIQYAWDHEAQLGHFWAEIPELGAYAIRPTPGSPGLTHGELRRIITDRETCPVADEVDYVAAAEGMAPAGPLPGLDGAGLVERACGLVVPLESLVAGDEIIAADDAPAQIRWIGSADVPAFGRMMPYRLNAPYHGARTPLVLAASSLLRRKGIEVEYLFGESEVAVHVGHLKDNVAIVPFRAEHEAIACPLVRYRQLILDRPVPIRLSGVVVETLDFTQMAETPDLYLRSILGPLPPEMLSREKVRRCKVLRDYEAQSLRQMQAA